MKKIRAKGLFSLGLFFLLLFMVRAASAMPSEECFPKVSFKLSGGPGIMAVGDINTALRSLSNNKIFRDLRRDNPNSDPDRSHVEGHLRPLRSSFVNWEAELRIDLTSRLAFGISTFSPLHRRNESSLTYTYVGSVGSQVRTWTFRPEFSVSHPLMVNFYYSRPFMKKLRYSIGAGAGFYSARVSQEMEIRAIYPVEGSALYLFQWDTERKFSFAFQGHVALSLDYSLSSRLSLVTELQARFIRLSDFKGTWSYTWVDFGYREEKSGTLCYFSMWDIWVGFRYNNLDVWPDPSNVEDPFRDIKNLRKAVLDLSGMSLRVGFRLRLF